MVFSKLALDCAADVPGSPVLTAIARNGVEVGIRVSGHRRPLVRRPGRAARPGEAVRRLHAGGHEPGPRRLRDRRDLRPRRAGRRRLAALGAVGRHRPGDDRAHRRRAAAAIAAGESPDIALPGRARRRSSASTRARSPRRASRRPSTPGSRTSSRASARSAAASPTRRWTRSTTPSRRSVDPRRGGPPGAARRAARGRVPVRPAPRRGAAGRALRDQPDAGARGAAPARGRRARRPRPLRRRCGPNPPRVSVDARALRRPHRARGPRGAHRRPGRASTGCVAEWLELRAEHDDGPDFVYADEAFHEGIARASRQQRHRALHPRHQRAHPPDPDPRLHDAGPDRGDDRGAPGDPGDRPRRARRRRRRADARAHRAQRRGRGAPRGRAARPHVRGGAP